MAKVMSGRAPGVDHPKMPTIYEQSTQPRKGGLEIHRGENEYPHYSNSEYKVCVGSGESYRARDVFIRIEHKYTKIMEHWVVNSYKIEHPYGGGFDSSEGRFEGKAGDRGVFDESDRNGD
jgi:hypothetical protein